MTLQIDRLLAQNKRLIALLERHGIDWKTELEAKKEYSPTGLKATYDDDPDVVEADSARTSLSTDEKVDLFRSLFRGRDNVHAVRWESTNGERSGYSPACANEWRAGVCNKPRIKCSACQHQSYMPLDENAIYNHLAGKKCAGVYPLLPDNNCFFLAVDFDKQGWREDVQGFASSCATFDVPVALEISRSGNGAHAWIFFNRPVPARQARLLGTLLITHTCSTHHQLDLSSYDRLFPNQDTMPQGGFGNLIALPLYKPSRELGRSVFVDDELNPESDQWTYLQHIKRMSVVDLDSTLLLLGGATHPLDVSFVDEEDLAEPWKRRGELISLSSTKLPEHIDIVFSDKVYVEKCDLPVALQNRLVRLAAFQNPEFYKAQAMRFPVWGKPRVIGCADNYPFHIGLPRGCLEAVLELLGSLGITANITDERLEGDSLTVSFRGTLSADQQHAVSAMLAHDTGILSAPTAFGKTVAGAAIIAKRRANTLIIVHRTELLDQWVERLTTFLDLPAKAIGQFGGGRKKTTRLIDVALVQSLSRKGEVNELVEGYGQVIVDECHHLGAQSFEAVLKRVKARYVLGLTATPIRRDGQQPIIYMQCGPIRHRAKHSQSKQLQMMVEPHYLDSMIQVAEGSGIQDIFKIIANDSDRTGAVARIASEYIKQGRNVLLLTERTDHVEAIKHALPDTCSPYVLHGKIPKKQRKEQLERLKALEPDASRLLLATGKLVGEGFDHAALDVLVLAMPISWKGTLQQYAGRLHRDFEGKDSVTVVDFVDLGHPALVRMWERRQRGYKAMGYQLVEEDLVAI